MLDALAPCVRQFSRRSNVQALQYVAADWNRSAWSFFASVGASAYCAPAQVQVYEWQLADIRRLALINVVNCSGFTVERSSDPSEQCLSALESRQPLIDWQRVFCAGAHLCAVVERGRRCVGTALFWPSANGVAVVFELSVPGRRSHVEHSDSVLRVLMRALAEDALAVRCWRLDAYVERHARLSVLLPRLVTKTRRDGDRALAWMM